jgi:hypothetical protein
MWGSRPTDPTGDPVTLLPTWAGAILACVPNLVLGILILIFRRPISSFLSTTLGRLTYANPTVPMTLVVVAGVFLVVAAGGLLTSAIVSAVSA